MKKGLLSILFAVIILASISVSVNAATTGPVPTLNPGHNSTQIFISVGNGYITLQNAIDRGFFVKSNTSLVATTALPVNSPYHLANETLINVSSGSTNYTMTLQEAINYNVFFNVATTSYTSSLPVKEYAFNINVNTTSNIRNLHYAIKNNLLSLDTYSWYTSAFGACPTSCGGSHSRTVYCQRNPGGTLVADSFCTTAKPATTASCSCTWVDYGHTSCETLCIAFCTMCSNNKGGNCNSWGAGSTMHCLWGGDKSCGTSGLGQIYTILECTNR